MIARHSFSWHEAARQTCYDYRLTFKKRLRPLAPIRQHRIRTLYNVDRVGEPSAIQNCLSILPSELFIFQYLPDIPLYKEIRLLLSATTEPEPGHSERGLGGRRGLLL
jgi:hypothetical protein